MDYATMCRIVGELYLESRRQISQSEEKLRTLLLENTELKKKLAELNLTQNEEQRVSDK